MFRPWKMKVAVSSPFCLYESLIRAINHNKDPFLLTGFCPSLIYPPHRNALVHICPDYFGKGPPTLLWADSRPARRERNNSVILKCIHNPQMWPGAACFRLHYSPNWNKVRDSSIEKEVMTGSKWWNEKFIGTMTLSVARISFYSYI